MQAESCQFVQWYVNTVVTQSIAEVGSYFEDNTKINNAME
jgi:hypothetical protein